MRQLQVFVLYDFLLHIHCVLFSLASSATAKCIPSPPSEFWLTHSSFCSWQGNSTPPHGIFSSAVPASARLASVSQFPRVRIHWRESSFPWVNCKPSFWIDGPWLRYNRTHGLFSCARSRAESRVRWYKACPPGWEDPGTTRVFLRRANAWVGMMGPIQYSEVLQSRPIELGWQLSMLSQVKSTPPICSCLRCIMGPYCGSMAAGAGCPPQLRCP